MATKKDIKRYLNLNWSYTIEQETEKGKHFYIIRVNELPGICTDAETIEEGMENIREAIEAAIYLYLEHGKPIPVPIKKEAYKGNIAYRTTSERHYTIAKVAKQMHKSISKTLDDIIDAGIDRLQPTPHFIA
jgi:predicted RNase H-like HicB family nuclease